MIEGRSDSLAGLLQEMSAICIQRVDDSICNSHCLSQLVVFFIYVPSEHSFPLKHSNLD